MRTNIPPIKEPFFDAEVLIPNKNPNLPPLRLPVKFKGTTRPWTEWANNLARQANAGAEAEIAEDLFAGISPEPHGNAPTEQELFGNTLSPLTQSVSEQELFGQVPQPRQLSSLARHFLFMGS